MGMGHFTSGKSGYKYWGLPCSPNEMSVRIPPEKLATILLLEERYRASQEYQDKYSERDDLEWFETVTIELQRRVLVETGVLDYPDRDDETKFNTDFSPQNLENERVIEAALLTLWGARSQYANNDSLNKLVVYSREDKSGAGVLVAGSPMPNVRISDRSGNITRMSDYYRSLQLSQGEEHRGVEYDERNLPRNEGRPLFIVAGSVS